MMRSVDLNLTVDAETLRLARARADALGTTVEHLVSKYLEDLAGQARAAADAEEFLRLSRLSAGHSGGWKLDRDDLHTRR